MLKVKYKKFKVEKLKCIKWTNKIKIEAFLNLLVNNFFSISFLIFFFVYIKMSKDSYANYYQENKERPQKRRIKDIKG